MAWLCFAPAVSAVLKPLDDDFQRSANKSVLVFKTTPQGDLRITVYFPENWWPQDRRSAVVFFFGGAFVGGSPTQFRAMAEYFTHRGMVAATPEYRVKTTHQTMADKSIEDAKSAIRWLRAHAARLGIDPNRIVAGGASAGGTAAVLSATSNIFEPEGEDPAISSRPNALLLYNPALGLGRAAAARNRPPPNSYGAIVSAWKVSKGAPPTIVFFGTEDALLESGRDFVQQMIAAGNRCELYTAAGQKHGFFNASKIPSTGATWYAAVLLQTDAFLRSLGYLDGSPPLEMPADVTGKVVLKKVLP